MPRQTGKGPRNRRESALERKATHHHEFIGEAQAERAEAELRKHERVEQDRNQATVREMARELEKVAGVKKGDGAIGPEIPIPFRIPRSIDEGKRMIREAPDYLRDKARERLEKLPEPAQKALHVAESAMQILLMPLRFGLNLARDVLSVPAAMLRVLRKQEV